MSDRTRAKFTVHARRKLLPDGQVVRELLVGQFSDETAKWGAFSTTGNLRNGDWLSIVGFEPDDRELLNQVLRPVLFASEALGARLCQLLYNFAAPAGWYEALFTMNFSAVPILEVQGASLQVCDEGYLAQLRGWRIDEDHKITVDGPVAAISAREPGWQAVLTAMAESYDDQAKALLLSAMNCLGAEQAIEL